MVHELQLSNPPLLSVILRVLGPNVVPRIPSLGALLEQRADLPIPIPSSFPSETKKSDSNSHQFRYSDTGVHENLHSNLPPSTMSFTQEPIPNILSQRTLDQYGPKAPFRHRAVVRDWVEDIFTRGGYQDLVEYDTAVEHAVKKGQEWVLTLRKTTPGKTTDYWWQETFDSLVVASGHYSLPHIPNIPGLVEYDQKFPGTIRHSKHFRSANEFKGKVGLFVYAFICLVHLRQILESTCTDPHIDCHSSRGLYIRHRCCARNPNSSQAPHNRLPKGASTCLRLGSVHTSSH